MNTTRMLLVLFVILSPMSSTGAESPVDHDGRMRHLLERCGILDRLQEFPRQVFQQMGYEENLSQPKRYAPGRETFFQAFNVKEMEKDLIEKMSEQMDAHSIALTLEWFESPIGRKIIDLERTTYTAHAWQGKQVFVQGLAHNPPAEDRIAKIQRLVKAIYLSQIDEDLEMTTALALTGAMNAKLPQEERIDPDHIRGQLQAQREDMKEALQEEQLVNFLYLYHQLPESEIEQYLGFLDSDSGKRFNSAMLVSLRAVFQSAAEKIGTALGRALNGERRI